MSPESIRKINCIYMCRVFRVSGLDRDSPVFSLTISPVDPVAFPETLRICRVQHTLNTAESSDHECCHVGKSNRIHSNSIVALFVGRKQELQAFQDVLQMDCPFRFLTIHSDGEGGIGKTQFSYRCRRICESHPEITLFTKGFVDFYQTESRTHLGVMRQIVSNLKRTFLNLISRCKPTRKQAIKANARNSSKVETTFQKEFAIFSENTSNGDYCLFFDTYEAIPGTEIIRNGKNAQKLRFFSLAGNPIFPGIAT